MAGSARGALGSLLLAVDALVFSSSGGEGLALLEYTVDDILKVRIGCLDVWIEGAKRDRRAVRYRMGIVWCRMSKWLWRLQAGIYVRPDVMQYLDAECY